MSEQTFPAASILVVDDEKLFRDVLCSKLREHGFEVDMAVSGIDAIAKVQAAHFDLILLDIKMPRVNGIEVLKYITENGINAEVIMLTTFTDVRTAVETVKLGAYDYVSKPYNFTELLQTIERAIDHRKLRLENVLLKSELDRRQQMRNVIGTSATFQSVLDAVYKVAPTDSDILLSGPEGSGKEILGNLVFRLSTRKDKPFVVFDATHLTDLQIESELFGHERGAVPETPALRNGLVEIANHGTLFIDEVANIPISLHPKMLRFLQTGEFRRIGGTQTLKSNVRVLASTSRNLANMVKEDLFREDLFLRLSVITISVPPLKERKEDIAALVEHFMSSKSRGKTPKQITEAALEKLEGYYWPGNVRELENVIERAIIMTPSELVDAKDIVLEYSAFPDEGASSGNLAKMSLQDIERIHIERVLKDVQYNKRIAAEVLEISLRTLYTKIYDYQIHIPNTKGEGKSDKH